MEGLSSASYPLIESGTTVIPMGSSTMLLDERDPGLRISAPGRIITGHDNAVFGRWNCIFTWIPRTHRGEVIRAHGGEIIPGRFADHVDRMRANVRTGTFSPVQLDLDISMACASACSFCFSLPYRSHRTSGRFMSWPAIRAAIESAATLGVRVVRFDGGGDPLTHPRVLDAVRLCVSQGLGTAVLTSGDRLSPDHVEAFLDANSYLRISLNAATAATRSAVHAHRPGTDRLTPILACVRLLSQARRGASAVSNPARMPLGATFMLHPVNIHEVYAAAVLARESGFDHLSYRVVLGDDHRVTFTTGQRDTYERDKARVLEDIAGHDFQAFFPTRDLTDRGYRPQRYFGTCLASTHRALVEVGASPDRPELIPCGRYRGSGFSGDGASTHSLGTLTEQGLLSVWGSPRMRAGLSHVPAHCPDCIDRSANLMLIAMRRVLREDIQARFFRMWAVRPPPPHQID
jgi:hypothetical protein